MRLLLLAAVLWPSTLLAQSPFDGAWVVKLDSVHVSNRPEDYLLQNGTYECATCVPRLDVKADAKDYPVAGSPYFSHISVRVLDNNSVEITEKKSGKIVYSETDTVSPDGNTLTQKISDSAAPSGQPVTAEETYTRLKQGPAGSNEVSGLWRAESIKNISENGITVTYHSIPGGLQALNPNGEGYSAKFDGKDYPIKGDPAHDTVALKRINARTIEETDKQEGAAHYKLRLVVSPAGRTLRVTETDYERGTRVTYTMEKRAQ